MLNNDRERSTIGHFFIGQPLVHLEYGVGRYSGMTIIVTKGIRNEYLILTYAQEEKLYVPISSLHLVSLYNTNCNNTLHVPLHSLSREGWLHERNNILQKIKDTASSLLDTYAFRKKQKGFKFFYNPDKYHLFFNSFPFTLTRDQQKAVNDIFNDMSSSKAMDRLVCGDVGFGKTEVAIRATFLALENKKQVAILAPTTLLVRQHFENFKKRFSKCPILVRTLSRFSLLKDQTNVLKELSLGAVDILIGTHKLLDRDVKFKNLGLLIIDEEHRFGVSHKEKIKTLSVNIDILTLTATPIPRTLYMALNNVRDLSVISTPPKKRLSIKTSICVYSTKIVRTAVLQEIRRSGQVYYVYNNVKKIQKKAYSLKKLIPEANIVVGHGQMSGSELEKVMHDFQRGHFNVLLCTTIIDTGIDIPAVNTIIIERSDRFGLAQLHQLRGRVGRSYKQAYAWLLLPSERRRMTLNAQKRLEAISSLKELGAGFTLATQDLEIRGAGDLLGEEQSGKIMTIGVPLYKELLKHAIESLKDKKYDFLLENIYSKVEIELGTPALLPDSFIKDVNLRLSFYKKIISSKNQKELLKIKVELEKNFGSLPTSAITLLDTALLRQKAKIIGIERIEMINEKKGIFQFNKKHRINLTWLTKTVLENPQEFYFKDSMSLIFIQNISKYEDKIAWLLNFIKKMEKI